MAKKRQIKICMSKFSMLKADILAHPETEFVSIDSDPPSWWKGPSVKSLIPSQETMKEYYNIRNRTSVYALTNNEEAKKPLTDLIHRKVLSKTTPEKVLNSLRRLYPKAESFCLLSSGKPETTSYRTIVADWFNGSECAKTNGIFITEIERKEQY